MEHGETGPVGSAGALVSVCAGCGVGIRTFGVCAVDGERGQGRKGTGTRARTQVLVCKCSRALGR